MNERRCTCSDGAFCVLSMPVWEMTTTTSSPSPKHRRKTHTRAHAHKRISRSEWMKKIEAQSFSFAVILLFLRWDEWMALSICFGKPSEWEKNINKTERRIRAESFLSDYIRVDDDFIQPHRLTPSSRQTRLFRGFLLFVSVCIVAQKNSRWATEDESSYFCGAVRISCAIAFVADNRGKINLKGFQQSAWRQLWPFLKR